MEFSFLEDQENQDSEENDQETEESEENDQENEENQVKSPKKKLAVLEEEAATQMFR